LGQNYFIWHEKTGWNVKHVMGKMKKKVNLGILGVSIYVSKGVPQSCLDHLATISPNYLAHIYYNKFYIATHCTNFTFKNTYVVLILNIFNWAFCNHYIFILNFVCMYAWKLHWNFVLVNELLDWIIGAQNIYMAFKNPW